MQADVVLDVTGLNCPLPLLRTKKALAQMQAGQVLEVIVTDPGAEIDFRVYTEASGNPLLKFEKTEGRQVFHIRKQN